MKAAIKEYYELCTKPELGWIKRHWKGFSMVLLACLVLPSIIYGIVVAIKGSDFTKVFDNKEKFEEEEEK